MIRGPQSSSIIVDKSGRKSSRPCLRRVVGFYDTQNRRTPTFPLDLLSFPDFRFRQSFHRIFGRCSIQRHPFFSPRVGMTNNKKLRGTTAQNPSTASSSRASSVDRLLRQGTRKRLPKTRMNFQNFKDDRLRAGRATGRWRE